MEKAVAPHSSTPSWKIPWTEGLGGLQSMGSLSRTWLSDFTFTFHFHALKKEMATHSSVLDWRIPGTGEPDGLPSMGSQRVRRDWSDLAAVAVGRKRKSLPTPSYRHRTSWFIFAFVVGPEFCLVAVYRICFICCFVLIIC